MKNFVYNVSTKILFGKNTIEKLGEEISPFSKKILLVYGSQRIKKNGLFDSISGILKTHDIQLFELSGVKPNPSIKSVHEGIRLIKENQLGFILAVGGGSVIDAAKAMAVGASDDIDPWLICKRKTDVKSALPVGSVLTLSATGSEMNGNSVISNEKTGEKLPLGSDLLRPKFSILDPTLTFSVPKDQTAAGVVDIFTHVCEQYFEPVETNAVADRMAEGIMKVCLEHGRKAIDVPEDYEARANLMWAGSIALNSILTYGKTGGDWATHFIEHEISAAYDITHGVGLAIVLPNWMKYVLNNETVDKFASFAQNVFGINKIDKFEQAKAGIDATIEFFKSLDIPTKLSKIGIDDSKIEHMAEQAVQFGEIGSFNKLGKESVKKILEMCL